jgi:A/G-specific adenine glycosylase
VSTQAELLLHWYALNGRKLPWRDHPDPYAIWVSEIMLQQTRVDTVIAYYQKWMQKFPNLGDLAKATENELLSTWEGLGYYSRVRNLHRAAQIVVENYKGRIPENVDELVKLPGIGRYTAGAIASIAFKADVPTLDSNIRRVFSRLYNIEESVETTRTEKLLWSLLNQDLPTGKAGDYNQALMDLGATICTPKKPACNNCPLSNICQAKEKGVQEERPLLNSKPNQPTLYFIAALLRNENKFLLNKRPSKGLLGGLWEFPNQQVSEYEEEQELKLKQLLKKRFGIIAEVGSQVGVYKHTYTHFHQIMKVYNCNYISENDILSGINWVTADKLSNYPMGKIFRMISNSLVLDNEN